MCTHPKGIKESVLWENGVQKGREGFTTNHKHTGTRNNNNNTEEESKGAREAESVCVCVCGEEVLGKLTRSKAKQAKKASSVTFFFFFWFFFSNELWGFQFADLNLWCCDGLLFWLVSVLEAERAGSLILGYKPLHSLLAVNS